MKKEFLECGKVCSAHGVRGALKVESWCDSPSVLAKQKRVFAAEKDGGYREIGVVTASASDRFVIMTLDGVTDREVAQGLKNLVLYLKREDIPLPEGRYFVADLYDLPVIDVDTGKVYGYISDVDDGVASRLFTVKTESGSVLIPDVPEFIKEVDTGKGVFIRPIPGFFD